MIYHINKREYEIVNTVRKETFDLMLISISGLLRKSLMISMALFCTA